jgi:hypothetical protein
VIVDGKRLSSFRQIDGRTGQWARSNYRGYCMCFNNPHYRTAYLTYLESLYALGIDGIMTDDVQYFGQGHACACEYCKEQYHQDTGYRLPDPGPAWERWYGNYRESSFVSWLEFRFRSVERFHEIVAAHYRSLGLRPCRPNYVSGALNPNPTAYALETLPDLDWIFQENCFSHIIRYSWPFWAVEAAHRFAVGRVRGIPPMSMFYPDRQDSLRFAWGLAQSWGCLYLGTPEGTSLASAERELRMFEAEHREMLREPRKLADIAIYDKKRNRDLYEHAATESLPELIGWAQACYLSGVAFDILKEQELQRLDEYKVLVLNGVAFLSDEEAHAFARFARAGGTVVWTGATGTLCDDGTRRDAPLAAFGIPIGNGIAAVARHRVGKGRLVLVPSGHFGVPVERALTADRWAAQAVRTSYQPPADVQQQERDRLAVFLSDLLPSEPVLASTCPEQVLVTAFESNAKQPPGLAVHLVNTAGCRGIPNGVKVSHEDPIPFDTPWEAGVSWTIRARTPPRLRDAKSLQAAFWVPGDSRPTGCPAAWDGGALVIQIPAQLLRWYGLVTVRPGS